MRASLPIKTVTSSRVTQVRAGSGEPHAAAETHSSSSGRKEALRMLAPAGRRLAALRLEATGHRVAPLGITLCAPRLACASDQVPHIHPAFLPGHPQQRHGGLRCLAMRSTREARDSTKMATGACQPIGANGPTCMTRP